MIDCLTDMIADAAMQAADGAKFPISGRVRCPKCDNATGLLYTYSKPRMAAAACACGFSFLS